MKKIFTILIAFFAFGLISAQNVTVSLEAHDVWEDGTGYQLWLTMDTTAFGQVQDTWNIACDDPGIGNVFEYVIPAVATTINDNDIVADGIESISVPAGLYLYIIFNPLCIDETVYMPAADEEHYDQDSYGAILFESGFSYAFLMTGGWGTGDIVSIIVTEESTGITEVVALKDYVSIYPNPVQDVLHVSATGFDNVEIVNFLGQVVYQNQVTNNNFQINTADLTDGVYFVRLIGENTVTKKFIKR